MQKQSAIANDDFKRGSQNWLLYSRYVRGEHAMCLKLVEDLQNQTDDTHRYAYYIKGAVLADAGRYQEAVDKFHTCIRLQPQDPEPLKQVAKCLYQQGRYQLALEAYLEADKISKHPDPEIYCALAECSCHVAGAGGNGVEWARAAQRAGGGERAAALLARLLLTAGEVPGALVAYEHALASHACGADTLAAAGALSLRAGDPRRAFQLLGEALSQQPTQHAAALALAAMLLQHKDVDAALARLKAALSAHPTCVAAHSNLGLALLMKKKYVAAMTCLSRAAHAAPLSARAAHNLGLALLACKRPASAFCRLACAAALRPAREHTVLLIGIALERLGDSRADAAYSRAVDLSPRDPLVRLNLAGRHARAGRLVDAAEEARVVAQLLQQAPDAQLSSLLTTLMNMLPPMEAPGAAEKPIDEDSQTNEEFQPDEIRSEQQRQAGLIILPPIILGYDELYEDSTNSQDLKFLQQQNHKNANNFHSDHRHSEYDYGGKSLNKISKSCRN